MTFRGLVAGIGLTLAVAGCSSSGPAAGSGSAIAAGPPQSSGSARHATAARTTAAHGSTATRPPAAHHHTATPGHAASSTAPPTTAHHSTPAAHPTTVAPGPVHTTRPTRTTTHPTPPAPHCGPPPAGAAAPVVVVCPSTGLSDGQRVTVYASGFPARASVVVIECADKGSKTGESDCNKINSARAGEDGTLTYSLAVYVHVSAKDTCSAAQPCLVSVTQPSLLHSYEADAEISFR